MAVEFLLAISGVFVLVAVLTGTATSWWFTTRSPERRRLQRLTRSGTGVLADASRLAEAPDPALARLSRMLPRSPKDMNRLQRRLTKAGYPHFRHAVYFALAELLLPLALAVPVLVVVGFGSGALAAVLLAVLGFAAPGLYIGRRTKLRQKAIQNGLPDALDLLTVCVEAGSGLDQALSKTSVELRHSHPELAVELQYIVTETRAGKTRLEAFRNFAQRTGVEDARTLAAMLAQTDRFGTSIGDALRTQADTSRTKRRQRAEERANKVGVKLVFPLALCLFPALYVVCFGPVVVRVYRAFF